MSNQTHLRNEIETVFNYHELTKHHLNRYADGPHGLDWRNQPNPFRQYSKEIVKLKLPDSKTQEIEGPTHLPYNLLYSTQRDSTITKPVPLSETSISNFLYYSMSISAWKHVKDTSWSLRVNPSSGNLHPTETYVVLSELLKVQDSNSSNSSSVQVYHYSPKNHQLELRCSHDSGWNELTSSFPQGSFFVSLTSIHWRESWKYGTRAFRYCLHDTGHAMAALRLSCSLLGWKLQFLSQVPDSSVSKLLGTDRTKEFHQEELEDVECIAVVTPSSDNTEKAMDEKDLSAFVQTTDNIAASAKWFGIPNRLSRSHKYWDIIEDASEASKHNGFLPSPQHIHSIHKLHCNIEPTVPDEFLAAKIIRQRRSAVDMDGHTSITLNQFVGMLARTVPAITSVPWDSFPYPTSVHLAIFVHRVIGLPKGMYLLVRDLVSLEKLKKNLVHKDVQFLWSVPENIPQNFPLYCLHKQDVTSVATLVSCEQEIAGNGCFSLGMIADFEDSIEKYGPAHYRKIFWETGMVGQVLYLEAEAHGVRATGIGCFFDDEMHHVFGIHNKKFQSLYHFTVGGPIEDKRLRTLEAYESKDSNPFDS